MQEIWVGEHDGDVRFLTGSRNVAVLRMRNRKICKLSLTCGHIAYELGDGADHEKLDTFSINVQRYSQHHAQNCIFGPAYGGIRGKHFI